MVRTALVLMTTAAMLSAAPVSSSTIPVNMVVEEETAPDWFGDYEWFVKSDLVAGAYDPDVFEMTSKLGDDAVSFEYAPKGESSVTIEFYKETFPKRILFQNARDEHSAKGTSVKKGTALFGGDDERCSYISFWEPVKGSKGKSICSFTKYLVASHMGERFVCKISTSYEDSEHDAGYDISVKNEDIAGFLKGVTFDYERLW